MVGRRDFLCVLCVLLFGFDRTGGNGDDGGRIPTSFLPRMATLVMFAEAVPGGFGEHGQEGLLFDQRHSLQLAPPAALHPADSVALVPPRVITSKWSVCQPASSSA